MTSFTDKNASVCNLPQLLWLDLGGPAWYQQETNLVSAGNQGPGLSASALLDGNSLFNLREAGAR